MGASLAPERLDALGLRWTICSREQGALIGPPKALHGHIESHQEADREAASFQPRPTFSVQHCAAAASDHLPADGGHIGAEFGLQAAEPSFTVFGEDLSDSAISAGFDLLIQVNEGSTQTVAEHPTDRGLTAAHESDQHDISGHSHGALRWRSMPHAPAAASALCSPVRRCLCYKCDARAHLDGAPIFMLSHSHTRLTWCARLLGSGSPARWSGQPTKTPATATWVGGVCVKVDGGGEGARRQDERVHADIERWRRVKPS